MSSDERPANTTVVGVERKLAAILSADVKGYSRLMGEDEVATLRTLTTYRELIAALIRQHRGRVVGSAGDSLLAEFASVVDAMQCAVVIQTTLKAENANLPPQRRMEFHIGINSPEDNRPPKFSGTFEAAAPLYKSSRIRALSYCPAQGGVEVRSKRKRRCL